MAMKRRKICRTILGVVRLVNGTGALLAPKFMAKRFGVDADANPSVIYIMRLFGVRTIILGLEFLILKDEDKIRDAVRVGVLIHASDTTAAVIAGVTGQLPVKAAAIGDGHLRGQHRAGGRRRGRGLTPVSLALPRTVPGKALLAVRLVFGAAWLVPVTALRVLGMNPDQNREAAYVGRLFAARDAALGIGLMASSGDSRKLWWRIGIGCDIADAMAGLVSARRGELPNNRRLRISLFVAGIVGAALGASALAKNDV